MSSDYSLLLGRLDYAALPFYSPIAFLGAAVTVSAGVGIVIALTYFKLWKSFWTEWLTSVDHKRIGIMYVVMALVLLLRGFADAIMMRTQQAMSFESGGYLPPDHFNQVFSAHGTIMVLFMAMPFLTGIMNLVVPLQIGARDVAFPVLNSIGLFLTAGGAALILISLVIGVFTTGGWTGYTPYTGVLYSPGVGVEYWGWALALSGVGTTFTGINFIATILFKRAPGMRLMDMPLFTWTVLIDAVLMLLAFPALTAVVILLEAERLLGMPIFTNDRGGNVMNFVNMLWIWGHPEVYIVVLPAFGIFSEVVATFCRKRLFGYAEMVYAVACIGFLSFTVWLHHFFTLGASASVNGFFGITTMIISVPTGIKVFNWIFTMYRGRIRMRVPMYWTVGFMIAFVIGGMTGVILAIPPVDWQLHNTVFLVAHFHNMLIPGTFFGAVAAMNYWFPKAFGFALSPKWGLRAFVFWFVGFFLAFMPLYYLGLDGMPRRMENYSDPNWQKYLIVACVGAFSILFGIICQVVQIIVSIRDRNLHADVTGDPWDGRTLEWSTSSPPPEYNFAVVPVVTSRDQFWEDKKSGKAYQLPDKFEAIRVPKNTAIGVVIGVGGFLLAFGIVWFMWWMAILGGIIIIAGVIGFSFDDDRERVIPAAEIEKHERARHQKLMADLKRYPVSDTDTVGRFARRSA